MCILEYILKEMVEQECTQIYYCNSRVEDSVLLFLAPESHRVHELDLLYDHLCHHGHLCHDHYCHQCQLHDHYCHQCHLHCHLDQQ